MPRGRRPDDGRRCPLRLHLVRLQGEAGRGDRGQGARSPPRRGDGRPGRLAARGHHGAPRGRRLDQGGLGEARAGRRRRHAPGRAALAARGEPRRRTGRVPPRRHRRRREPRGGACGGRRDHRRLAARGRPVRALVGGPLRRRPWLPPERARRGARPPREDGPCDAGLREARALRAGRAEPRHGGARDRVRARAGAGPALRQGGQHGHRLRAAAARGGARERAARRPAARRRLWRRGRRARLRRHAGRQPAARPARRRLRHRPARRAHLPEDPRGGRHAQLLLEVHASTVSSPPMSRVMNHAAIRDKVAIVGMGCCKFGENWDQAPADMIVDAAYEAYADAGIDEPQRQIEAVFCGAQYPSRGTAEVADALKLYDRPVSMVVNYCATGTDAFRYGVFAVACGMYDTVLVVGFDKPKDRGVSGPSVAVTGVRGLPATPAGWFSHVAARYFETFGAGREDLARIAVKNHHNGTLAPKSMLKREITVEEALGARMISWHFGLYDCAAQYDGAAAAMLTRRVLATGHRDDFVLVRAVAIGVAPDPKEDPDFDFLR